MDQLICAFLSHTHYWYEVGMLKVYAMVNINTEAVDIQVLVLSCW